jgi:hypothetical protein
MGKLLTSDSRLPREPWTVASAALNEALNDYCAQYPLTQTAAFIAWGAVGGKSDSIFVSLSETEGDHWHPDCAERLEYLATLIDALPEQLRETFCVKFARLTLARVTPASPQDAPPKSGQGKEPSGE